MPIQKLKLRRVAVGEARRNQHRESTRKNRLAIDRQFETGRSNLAGHWQEKVARRLPGRGRSNKLQRFSNPRRHFAVPTRRTLISITSRLYKRRKIHFYLSLSKIEAEIVH